MQKKMETTVLGFYIYIYIHPSSPFLGTLNIRCRIIIGIQEGTIILPQAWSQFGFGGPSGVARTYCCLEARASGPYNILLIPSRCVW